jgi:hypothetical protein
VTERKRHIQYRSDSWRSRPVTERKRHIQYRSDSWRSRPVTERKGHTKYRRYSRSSRPPGTQWKGAETEFRQQRYSRWGWPAGPSRSRCGGTLQRRRYS